MKQIIRLALYSRLFLLRRGIFIIPLLLILIFGIPRIVSSTERFRPHTTYEGYVGAYTVANLPKEILLDISSGLTAISEDGRAVPSLSSSWTVEEEGKVWRFYLSENIKWQDGRVVDPSSINYHFDDVTIERVDPNQLVFRLSSPYAAFSTIVSRPTFSKGLTGVGQWVVTAVKTSDGIVEELTLESGGLKRVLRFYPTEDQAKIAFELGKIDQLKNILNSTTVPTDWKNVNIDSRVDTSKYVAVFFNMKDPLFESNKPLRQALSYAIDKSEYGTSRALGPIPSTSWAYNKDVKPYEFDLARAKSLLVQNGKAGERISFELSLTSNLLPVAEKLANEWKEMGVDVVLKIVNGKPETFQAFLATYDSGTDPDQYVTWHSTQEETNIARYSNPRIDKLLEDGRLTLDEQKRRNIYLDFQRFLLEDVPAIFLYNPSIYSIVRK